IRLRCLEDRAELADLMARYASAADRKYRSNSSLENREVVVEAAQDQALCFTKDGKWYGGDFGGTRYGRDEIASFFECSPWRFASHLYASPSISLDEDKALMNWRLVEIGLRDDNGQLQLLVGSVRQRCRRTLEGWRIEEMSFEQLHAVTLSQQADAL